MTKARKSNINGNALPRYFLPLLGLICLTGFIVSLRRTFEKMKFVDFSNHNERQELIMLHGFIRTDEMIEKGDLSSGSNNIRKDFAIIRGKLSKNERRDSPKLKAMNNRRMKEMQSSKKTEIVADKMNKDLRQEAFNNSSSESSVVAIPKRQCHVVIENKIDFHYELIESTALLFPLPWNDLPCDSQSQTVIMDVALTHKNYFAEREGFESYYRRYLLNNRTYARRDGSSVEIRYGDLVDITNYTKSYDATIHVSCDAAGKALVHKWVRGQPHYYCLLHKSHPEYDEDVLRKSCWLNPMHHPRCFFIPSVFPLFTNDTDDVTNDTDDVITTNSNTTNICAYGCCRTHDVLATALKTIQPSPSTVRVLIFGRKNGLTKEVFQTYKNLAVDSYVSAVRESDYEAFQRSVSRCDVMLPLISPERNYRYFPNTEGTEKKLAGTISQIVGYKLPTVMHEELGRVYGEYMTADYHLYNDTDSFIEGLRRVLDMLSVNYETQV